MFGTIAGCRPLLIALVCATLAILPVQRVSAASMAEYPLLLFLIALASDFVPQADLTGASRIVSDQLQVAAQGAEAANIIGNRATEVSRLSKAIGAAEALIGMTASCGNCDELRNALQQTVGVAAFLKTSGVGASGSCQPNGVIGPNEQCDPLAHPTGCQLDGTSLTYCSDECRCASPPGLWPACARPEPPARVASRHGITGTRAAPRASPRAPAPPDSDRRAASCRARRARVPSTPRWACSCG